MLHRILRISLSLLNLRKAQAAALYQCLLLFAVSASQGNVPGHTVIAELFKICTYASFRMGFSTESAANRVKNSLGETVSI